MEEEEEETSLTETLLRRLQQTVDDVHAGKKPNPTCIAAYRALSD
jgi:hypothetical protein